MLVLKRKLGERVTMDLGSERSIVVAVTEIHRNFVVLGITAPLDVHIDREDAR